ncbi:MAG TPA: ATP-binding protein [Usitatibacter sp.]|nr:ATP-binding protein [Usitatibacter sp.]
MDDSPLQRLPRTPSTHFALLLHSAIVALIARLAREQDVEGAFRRFPFLEGYADQLARIGLNGVTLGESLRAWRDAVERWEQGITGHLALRALRRAYGLDAEAIEALMATGLVDEDARFGAVFAALAHDANDSRPTAALLADLHDGPPGAGRARLHELEDAGLLEGNPPRVASALWTAISGEPRRAIAAWAHYEPASLLPRLCDLVLADDVRERAARLPAILRPAMHALVVRGPRRNGRSTLVGAIAREMGCGLLRLDWPAVREGACERCVGPLAMALDAVPLIVLEAAPGETIALPAMPGLASPLAIVLGTQGGVAGPVVDDALSLRLDLPDRAARRTLWSKAAHGGDAAVLDELADRYRLPSGNIHRAAALARRHAELRGATRLEPADVEAVAPALNREGLDTLANAVPAHGSWGDIVTGERTAAELAMLEARCRHREGLAGAVGSSVTMNPGVRALFQGASGTGKTLAARVLAAALGKELYRVDLSAVVNKYVGETEKNLNRVFDRAEELDVILLVDEADAILAKRTAAMNNANDRAANTETNFVLQRLESFTGIFVGTTNSPEHIDPAFRRRMDAVIEFPAPQAGERRAILDLHLPREHAVAADYLDEVAYRCAMTGGQIRNAVLHASLLALDRHGTLGTADLDEGIRREYRKAGAICPLREARAAAMG